MKQVGILIFLLLRFLYIFLLCCSVFAIGVLSDPENQIERTLNIQPTITIVSNNTSDVRGTFADQEAIVNHDKDNLVSDYEANLESGFDSLSSDVSEQLPATGFSVVSSENMGVSKEFINNDTPIVITPVDSATEELHKRVKIQSPNQDDSEKNVDTRNITNVDNLKERSDINKSSLETESKLKPKNLTENNAEDIPSFSEWAQKHLEEAEKKEQVNFSTPNPNVNTSKPGHGAKLRWKNYASVDCGAKVILANPEAQHTWAILVGSRDEYILNPCNSKIWFIVELCEAIQLKKIDMANYELFSSSPKEFTVSVSDRFPTRDWSTVGEFTANDERDVQSFDVNTETFGKYVKVEIKSHYGSEHYCPLSLFRVYGMSVFEVLQKDDPAHEQPIEDDDDDDDDSLVHSSNGDSSNLLSSATDAVLSMVKKAAQVLGNKVNKTNESSQINNVTQSRSPIIKSCSSPSHYVVCNNCTDILFGKIFELLSCSHIQISNLVSIPFINKALINSAICHTFGFNFKDKTNNSSKYSGSRSVESFFPPDYLGAMCNSLAVVHNKVLHNISYQYANTTEHLQSHKLLGMPPPEPDIMPVIEEGSPIEILEHQDILQSSEPLPLEDLDVNPKLSCSTDTSYTTQTKQIKHVTTELPVNIDINIATGEDEDPENMAQKDIDGSSTETIALDVHTEIPSDVDLHTENSADDNVLMTELNTESTPVANTPTAASNLQGQKESVFLRLSNRIKALERNMSLSSQYLEELSKRYKKQVEEMQRVLEKTEQRLNEVTSKEEEQHKILESKLEILTEAIENLYIEKNYWKNTAYCLFLAISIIFLLYGVTKYSTPKHTGNTRAKHVAVQIQRRNSDVIVPKISSKKKKRRPSDQALNIVASASGDQEKLTKKRKKKNSNPIDSYNKHIKDVVSPTDMCKNTLTMSNDDWVEGRGRIIDDIPFALEEADSSTIETLPLPSTKINPPVYIKTATHVRSGRKSFINGKINNLECIKKRPSSPESPANGTISNINDHTPKKEKGSLKKLFKKVF